MRKATTGKIKKKFSDELVDNCRYRTDDGLMCAIGCHIADEHYSPDLEELAATSVPVREALKKSGAPDVDRIFLGSLQAIHDAYEPEEWKERLEKFAKDFELKSEI
jgi:hypothetical protein